MIPNISTIKSSVLLIRPCHRVPLIS
ncbi:Protein CBG25510 [Caenorhabditis briggsae]|uniref:Protein CBG25510 n=1 Tax=Caenorhabditis briggsae TaxID=6238 RepID=B6IEQ0_CAEBR|nr:Protein CBG25510 [Caenorhabditis briggsae]CAR98380.1 Protein CBG25510 [Caenorhabditis briggsae]